MNNKQHSDKSFITNEGPHNLYERFNILIKDTKNFDVLVGYFYITGFHLIYKSLEDTDKVRILVGMDADSKTKDLYHMSKKLMSDVALEKIVSEMNDSDDGLDIEEGVVKFLEWLKEGKLEIRACPEKNIHAKLYIMTFNDDDKDAGRVITGSSNFTLSGLKQNIEFNVELKNHADYDFALGEFEKLWENATTFDIGEIYIKNLPAKTWLRDDITPYQLYLKFLYEYFKEDLAEDQQLQFANTPANFIKYDYQEEAALNAKRILKEYGGVIIGDVVGLGKTYTVSMLLISLMARSKILVIAPPALVHPDNPGSWYNILVDFGIAAECESVGKLDSVLDRQRDYDYVIIDEAHHFRNEDTSTYEKMSIICRGKKVILVSATPLNNYPKDLLGLIKLFQNSKKSSIPNLPNLEDFFNELANSTRKLNRKNDHDEYIRVNQENAKLIREKVLKYLIVRRTRGEIEKYYKDDITKQKLRFPKVNKPESVFYQLNEEEDKVFDETVHIITKKIEYARYKALLYMLEESNDRSQQGQKNMVGFMKTLLIKRLESSFEAFRKSVGRFIRYHENFLQGIDEGWVYISKKYSEKLFDAMATGDDEEIEELVFQGKADRYPIDNFDPRLKEDVIKDLDHLIKLEEMWSNIKRDPKVIALKEILKERAELQKKVIIFTESKETAQYIKKEIEQEYPGEVLIFSGSSSKGDRNTVISNFDANTKNKADEYRILISTESLSEGVSLHRSNVTINYDIPWNPTRLMQRVGRVNRINTSFNEIHTFNFFPTSAVNDEIMLEQAAKAKIELFINLLGVDAQTLTDGEIMESHELFNKLMSADVLTGEGEEVQSELKYFKIIKEIRDQDRDLYEDIKALPKKARTARHHDSNENKLITYFRKNANIQKFFITDRDQGREIDFIEAASVFESEINDKAIKLPQNFYEKLRINKDAFAAEINHVHSTPQTSKGQNNEKKLSKYLQAIKKELEHLSDNHNYIMEVELALNGGLLGKHTINKCVKEIKNILDKPGKSLEVELLVDRIRQTIPLRYLQSNDSTNLEIESKQEVILSEYLVGNAL